MSSKRNTSHHRPYKIQEIPLGKTAVSQLVQRELKEHRVNELLADFDLNAFGQPELSWREGKYFIIDGQHRIEAAKRWLGQGWEIQKIECRVYQGLSEAEEAEMFLRLNDVLIVSPYDKFKSGVTAGRETEVTIKKILTRENLVLSRDQIPGAVCAVGTLVRVYKRSDAEVLAKALRVIRDAFGDAGFRAQVIDGIGHLCQRYDGALDEQTVVERLSLTRGGVNGLLNRADVLHKQTGNSRAQCVAAAAVDIYNSHRTAGTKRLPSWWKAVSQQEAANDPVMTAESAA